MEKEAWYPQDPIELEDVLEEYMEGETEEGIHGIVVPHAGYEFSGKIAGRAFSKFGKKIKKAVILGPSHYVGFEGVRIMNKNKTPAGSFEIMRNNFEEVSYEHSVDNQIPFLQHLNFDIEILPLVVGEVTQEDARKIAEVLLEIKDAVFVISSDLSHFLNYEKAKEVDKETIEVIERLGDASEIDACGRFPLMILIEMCKIKSWKPKLLEYKNSGDITGDKSSVVGYSSFVF